jgi:16S rRNA (cytosine967-C5)-methyltransferase
MIAPARRAASDALSEVADHGTDLGEAIARVRPTLADDRDRSLLLELVAGTLRMQAAIDYQLAQRVSRPLARLDAQVLRVLRLGAFQLLYLDRVPAAAAIDDAVELTRRAGKTSAAGLVNAVLRALSRDRGQLTWPERPQQVESEADQAALIHHLATVHSHPAWLVERWLRRHGADAVERWLAFNNRTPAMCLSPNLAAVSRDDLSAELAAAGVETSPTRFAQHGLVVTKGHPLSTRAFLEGRCVVQDEASLLIAELAAPAPGERMLDLCASPGGKTIHFAARAGATGLVVACDVRAHRLEVLKRTLTRCHATDVCIVHVPSASPLPFRDNAFDTVFIDAPCSGLGTIRRDPDIRWKRAVADLSVFADAQIGLLDRAADLVRAGGHVVYSTCSSEPEENEDVIERFRQKRPGFSVARMHHTWPFREALEAFFGAVLQRS